MRLAVERTEVENLFETLANKSPVGLCMVQDGRFCYTNPAFQHNTGYSEDELLGRDSLELVVPEDRGIAREHAVKMLKGESTLPHEFRVIHNDGSIHWVIESVVPVQYRGRPAILGNFVDITAHKQAEEALQAEKNKLQSLVDAMEDGLTILDPEYNIIFMNGLSRISTNGDHTGEKCYRVYEGRGKVCEGCPVEKSFKDGKSHTAERQRVLPSRELSFWENTANPIRDAKGRVVSCLEIGRNITERKKQEQALADELTRRRLLVDKSLDGIVVLDVDAKVVEANQRFAEMLGYTLEEVYKLHTWDWDKNFPPEQILEMGRNVDEKGLHLETKHTRKDGSVIDVDISISGIMYGGRKLIFCLSRDITEHNRAEEALKDSEESYRELADSITEVFFAMDEHLRYTYWNKASEILTGVRAEDALGKSLLEIFPDTPGTRKAEEVYRAVLKTQQSQTFVNEFDIDGRHYIFEIGAYPSRGGISVFVRNITERKQADEALQVEKNKLQSVVDAMADALTIQDRQYNIIFQNNLSKIIYGDHPGEKCYRIYAGREKMCARCPVGEAFKDGKPRTVERRKVMPSGEVVFWELTANPISDAKGEIVSCLEIGRNITERKRADEALRASEEMYKTVVSNALIGIYYSDFNGTLLYGNKKAEEIIGYKMEELSGKSFLKLKLLRPEGIAKAVKLLALNKLGKATGPDLFTLNRQDGTTSIVEIRTKVITVGGKKAVLGMVEDITERKQADEALQAEKNKLQSLIDTMDYTLTIQDTEYNIIYQNEPSRIASGGAHLGEKCYRAYEGRETVCDGCPVEEAFQDGKSHTTERRTTIAGEVAFWENTANPIRDSKGKIVSCLELARDITERKKQETALADELTQRRLLIDKSLDGIVVLDVDAKIVEANQRFADMLGYTFEEVCELHTWDWDKNFPPEQLLEMGRNVDEKGLHLETKHTRKDGSAIDVDISIAGTMYGGHKLIFCISRDITERNRSEKALKDSEESYRELADSITEVFFAMDEHLRYTYWNKASEILTGIRAEDALGKSLPEVFPDTPGERRAEKVYRTVLKTQKSRTFVNDFDIDGRRYIFEIGAYPSRGGISVFARDITDRKRAEEALRESEVKLSSILDNMADVVWSMTWPDGKRFFLSPSVKKVLGHDVQEFVEDPNLWGKILHPDDRSLAENAMEEIAQKGKAEYECRIGKPDGSIAWISIQGHLIYDNDGKAYRMDNLISDITERKKMEEAIKQAAEEWRKTFDSISDAISIHDRDHKILRANKAFADIFHKKPRQILGKHCYKLHKGNKPISGCPHKQTLATKKPAVAEFYESNLGKYLRESTSPIFDGKGEVVGTVHITRDVTEQKKQNERLIMADRLASIGELAAGTAHELNNPLTSVIGFSQLLIEKDIPDDIREDLKLIYNEAQRAAGVTKNLLAFARKHTPVKQPNQINNIIEDVLKLRAYEHKVNRIDVERQLAPALPEISVDYFQMQQVFLNIIINAEYFMTKVHNQGTLTITTKKQNGTVRISIADDGPGIPAEDLRRIFNPFFTTKETGKGNGLGLSICHGIVAEHGGQIYAKNQTGKGATIVIELPINSQ